MVLACRELGVALVPQGGNTGLVGGGVPLHGEVVLSLRRLDGHRSRSTRWPDRSPPAPAPPWPRCRRPPPPPAGPTAWTWPAATRPRSAARWPPTPAGCTSSATATPGPSCSGSRRCSAPVGGLPPGWPGQGQHRLRPARSALRERGDPGHGDRRPPAPGARPALPDRGPAGLRHRRRRGGGLGPPPPVAPVAGGLRALPRLRTRAGPLGDRDAGPVRRPHPVYLLVEAAVHPDPDRSPWPKWPASLDRLADAVVATEPAPRAACGATARPTPRRSTPWGHPTSST